ncbi:hypothetical protein GCM10022225_41010 [Plantactinospora mayteni]|uniref:Uncharacterized protein n=1 Tax=Plantactinospora mayteni TaxID=566021 RepID=A0ABQ4ETZ2_9ACTN|nr:hypothetical protein [Plantactinospora mayteni]GIG98125.1 hypothetical protein Pma05_46980 [Plantactinospora mayteni]
MRVSVLLILITVGLPGCASGTGISRPASVRHPAASPTPPAEAGRPEPDRGPAVPADPSGHGGAATSAAPADTERGWLGRRTGPWHRLPAQSARETPDAVGTADQATDPATGPDDNQDAYPAPAGRDREPDGAEEQRAGPPLSTDGPPPGYQRSLAYSGLLGLVISAVGLVMVGTRRRYW